MQPTGDETIDDLPPENLAASFVFAFVPNSSVDDEFASTLFTEIELLPGVSEITGPPTC